MRVFRVIAAVGFVGIFAGTAHAEGTQHSVVGNAFANTEGPRGGLLNTDYQDFGLPDPSTGEMMPMKDGKLGFDRSFSLAQGTVNAGPCEITGKLGAVSGGASVGLGASHDIGGKEAPSAGAGALGGVGKGGVVQCNVGVEAMAVSVSAECKTAIGTIAPSASGLGADAGCNCGSGCKAEAYWAKAGIDYTTPAVGGCGIKVSATVGAEVMAGVAAGVEKVGTAGAGVELGPVGLKAGVNVEELNLGKTADCVVDAAKKVGEVAANIGRGALNAAANVGQKIGGFFGGLFGGGDDSGTNVPRNAKTVAAARTPTAAAQPSSQGGGAVFLSK